MRIAARRNQRARSPSRHARSNYGLTTRTQKITTARMIRGSGWVISVLVCISGCDRPSRVRPIEPPPPQPVLCAEYPSDRQDVVSCRSVSSAQGNEVWARSTELAAATAIAQQFSHIQWLSVETRVETAVQSSPVDCTRHWGGIQCTGGNYEVPVGFVSVTRFAFLLPAEAQARLSDPLIPAERRPIDARAVVSSRRR